MFKIFGIYEGHGEVVDEFDTEEEAEKMLKEYKMAFGSGWYLYIKGRRRPSLAGLRPPKSRKEVHHV